jgi:hypothetical protein
MTGQEVRETLRVLAGVCHRCGRAGDHYQLPHPRDARPEARYTKAWDRAARLTCLAVQADVIKRMVVADERGPRRMDLAFRRENVIVAAWVKAERAVRREYCRGREIAVASPAVGPLLGGTLSLDALRKFARHNLGLVKLTPDLAAWIEAGIAKHNARRDDAYKLEVDELELRAANRGGCADLRRRLVARYEAEDKAILESLRVSLLYAYNACKFRRAQSRWVGGDHETVFKLADRSAPGFGTAWTRSERVWHKKHSWSGTNSCHTITVARDWDETCKPHCTPDRFVIGHIQAPVSFWVVRQGRGVGLTVAQIRRKG